jgi:hypothetical protein
MPPFGYTQDRQPEALTGARWTRWLGEMLYLDGLDLGVKKALVQAVYM